MDINVIVEPIEGGFRASALALSAEGRSRLEAIQRLKVLLQQPREAGGYTDTINLPDAQPHLRFAGMWDPNDPVIQEYLEILKENRRKADEEENSI